MEDLKGKIRVYVRVRPFSQKERDRGCTEAVMGQGKQTIAVQDPKSNGEKTFDFDQVRNCAPCTAAAAKPGGAMKMQKKKEKELYLC